MLLPEKARRSIDGEVIRITRTVWFTLKPTRLGVNRRRHKDRTHHLVLTYTAAVPSKAYRRTQIRSGPLLSQRSPCTCMCSMCTACACGRERVHQSWSITLAVAPDRATRLLWCPREGAARAGTMAGTGCAICAADDDRDTRGRAA